MKKLVVTICVLGILMGSVPGIFGQGGFFIGIQAGHSSQKPSLWNVEFSRDTTFLYGLRAGIKFLMLSVEANYFQAAHNLVLKELVVFDWGGKEVDYNYLGLNAKYFFPFLFLHPYITLGYGFYTADINTIDKDTKKGFNGGLGLEIHIGKKFSILGEGKYQHITLNIDERELKLGNFTLHVGFNFYF
jgi:hypothetical protein